VRFVVLCECCLQLNEPWCTTYSFNSILHAGFRFRHYGKCDWKQEINERKKYKTICTTDDSVSLGKLETAQIQNFPVVGGVKVKFLV
jgi:hypothetical protein